MGNRRLSRKRLYDVEKAGQAIDLESGPGIKHACSATQHRQGQELITEIVVDLGASGGGLVADSSADRAIGTGTGNVHITELTQAKYGIITEIRVVVMELPKISSSTRAVNVAHGDNAEVKNTALDLSLIHI